MKRRDLGLLAAMLACGVLASGCVSLSVMQGARTLAPGKSQFGFALGTGLFIACDGEPVVDNNGNWTGEWKGSAVYGYGFDTQLFYRAGIARGVDFGFMYSPPLQFRADVKFMFIDAEKFAGAIGIGGRIFASGSGGSEGGGRFYQGELATPLLFGWEPTPRFSLNFGLQNIAIFRGATTTIFGQTQKTTEFSDVIGFILAPHIHAGRRFSIILEAGFYKPIVMDHSEYGDCNPSEVGMISVFNIGFAWKFGRAENY